MHWHPYVHEKIRDIEAELAARRHRPERSSKGIIFGPVFRGAGRTLRRLGGGLESRAGAGVMEGERPELHLDRRAGT